LLTNPGVSAKGGVEASRAPSVRQFSLPDQRSRSQTAAEPWLPSVRHAVAQLFDAVKNVVHGMKRRWFRERRRRTVGRAYDMALEIARVIHRGADVLDVGCGNGFIAHHLSAILRAKVVGMDVMQSTEAPIEYHQYDRTSFPISDNSFDAVLLCYVLHHAQDAPVVLNEMRRILRDNGLAVIYEDVPQTWWDKGICFLHNQQWRARTGKCTFRQPREWRALFNSFSFEVMSERRLSRLRNLAHPVARRLFVLKLATSINEVSEVSRRLSAASHLSCRSRNEPAASPARVRCRSLSPERRRRRPPGSDGA